MSRFFRMVGRSFLAIVILLFLTMLGMYFGTKGDYTVMDTVTDDPSIPHIQVGNAILHAEDFGDPKNPTIVVIHGGPGNDYRYLLPLKSLSDSFHVVFYDQRGTGLSPRVGIEEHSLENTITDLHGVINYYSPDQPVMLIGHSWGAMVATKYIATYPEKVERTVLGEPGMLTTIEAEEYFNRFQFKSNWKLFKALAVNWFQSRHVDSEDQQAPGDFFYTNMTTLDIEGNPMRGYFCDGDISSAKLISWRLSSIAAQAIMSKRVDVEGRLQLDLVSGLENYHQKVLLFTGECNKIIGPDFQEMHLKYFQNIEMVVVEDAGHNMFVEQQGYCEERMRHYFATGV